MWIQLGSKVVLAALLMLYGINAQAQVVGQGSQGDAASPWFVTGTVTFSNVSIQIGGSLPTGTNTIGAVNLAQYTPNAGSLPVFVSNVIDFEGILLTAGIQNWGGTTVAPAFDIEGGAGIYRVPVFTWANDAVGGVPTLMGTPGNPVNVQISGTTTVSGTVTSNQGTPASTANRWPIQITDGTDLALVTAGGSLNVECTGGCGGAASFADNAAFTFGTTSINITGFVFDDTAPNTVTENNAAAPRMSANRVPYAQLRDAAGNERGANINASNALLTAQTGELPAGTQNIGDVDIASLPNEGQQTKANSISVTLASDQDAVAIKGQNSVAPIYCGDTAFVNITSGANTLIVTGTSSQVIYVCSYAIHVAAATDVRLFHATTGTSCATSQTNITPTYDFGTADVGINRTAGGGNIVTKTSASTDLCAVSTVVTDVDIEVSYTKF